MQRNRTSMYVAALVIAGIAGGTSVHGAPPTGWMTDTARAWGWSQAASSTAAPTEGARGGAQAEADAARATPAEWAAQRDAVERAAEEAVIARVAAEEAAERAEEQAVIARAAADDAEQRVRAAIARAAAEEAADARTAEEPASSQAGDAPEGGEPDSGEPDSGEPDSGEPETSGGSRTASGSQPAEDTSPGKMPADKADARKSEASEAEAPEGDEAAETKAEEKAKTAEAAKAAEEKAKAAKAAEEKAKAAKAAEEKAKAAEEKAKAAEKAAAEAPQPDGREAPSTDADDRGDAPAERSSVPVGKRVVFVGDYETGDASQWKTCQNRVFNSDCSRFRKPFYGMQVRGGGDQRQGEYAARYEIRNGDVPEFGGGERTEVSSSGGAAVQEGDERWYEFSLKFDEGFKNPNTKWFIVMQWHSGAGSPPLALMVNRNGELSLDNNATGTPRKVIGKVKRGEWVDYVLHVKFSKSASKGWAEVHQDGELVLPKHARATMSSSRNYLKQGIYRGTSDNSTAVVWQDGLRITAP